MDSRILILGGALLFVVVALVLLIASLSHAARVRRAASLEDAQSAWHADAKPPTREVDTSLEGLELKVAPESPSAALLQPLRMGDWQPPVEPAPVSHLAPASLEHRLKGFGGVEQVSASAATSAASDHAERLANLPDVLPAPDTGAPSGPHKDAPAPSVKALELVLPEVVIPAPTVSSAKPNQAAVAGTDSAPEPVRAEETAPDQSPVVTASPSAPAEKPAPEPATAPTPESTLDTAPTPPERFERFPAPSRLDELPVVAAVAPALTPEPEFPKAFEWQPPEIPVPQPAPPPAPVNLEPLLPLAPEPVPPVVEPPTPAPEPIVVATPAPITPVPERAQEVAVEPPSVAQAPHARPRARAHTIPSTAVAPSGGSGEASVAETTLPQLPTGEELVMAAPVEMWFGDYRVGVKLGTKTHAQFRKYADVLLGDLKGTGGRIR